MKSDTDVGLLPLGPPGRGELQAAPDLLAADPEGNIFEIPELAMAGRSGRTAGLPAPEDLIPAPEGSDFFAMPHRDPVGFERRTGRLVRLRTYRGIPVRAVAVFMAPAHTATWWSAFVRRQGACVLPLFAYTALGWRERRFMAAALRSDPDIRQDLSGFPGDAEMEQRGRTILDAHGENAIIRHVVENCALTYRCPAARNYVLGRWEAPLPISPGCNAACVGCISEPPKDHAIPPTQPRLEVLPTAPEIADMAVAHLDRAERPVVSFGQGCEGEPLLRADVMEEAIRLIRARTSRGVINLNTNASLPDAVERLARAGLDSIRISLNSARREPYERYYVPRGYTFDDVVRSGEVMRRHGKWISLNNFIFPGLTDHPAETEALIGLCRKVRPDLIQLRNLNMDPDVYCDVTQLQAPALDADRPLGIRRWMEHIRATLPGIRFGYFNPPREAWAAARQDGLTA
ncbi:MAG: radical SAM protein [Candidatus Eisenbacteria bacterium]|nr:radical SAM protein [Candidatus Eisenbacteria bacterium]